MGCFDVYCLICNNTTNNDISNDYIEELDINLKNNIKIFTLKTTHLNRCTLLLENNKIIHNCYENNGCGSFVNNDKYYGLLVHKKYDEDMCNKDEIINKEYGIFLHTDCWEYIKNKYNIELCFSNIKSNIVKDLKDEHFAKIDYGGIIDKYIGGQFMNFEKLIEDNNLYLCYSPLDYNEENNNRIDKIIIQVVDFTL